MFGMTRLPAPYPDEVIGGVVSRAVEWTGLPLSVVFEALAGVPVGCVSYFLPCHLFAIADSLCVSTTDVLQKHTPFPFLTYYEEDSAVSSMEQHLLCKATKPDRNVTGLLRSIAFRPNFLKFCPECLKRDEHTLGEPYWHLSHNLPFVQTCSEHQEVLWHFPPCTHAWHRYMQGLPDLRRGQPVTVLTSMELAHTLGRLATRMLRVRDGMSPAQREQILVQKGYRLGKLGFAAAQLTEDMRKFYGDRFLDSLNCSLGHSSFSWPRLLLPTRSYHAPAIKRALLDVFLTEADGISREAWTQSKPGVYRHPPDFDAILARRFRAEVVALIADGMSGTRTDVLAAIDADTLYWRSPSRFPLLRAAIEELEATRSTGNSAVRAGSQVLGRSDLTPASRDAHISEQDEKYAELLRRQIALCEGTARRFTVRELLQAIGFFSQYSRGKARYPLVAAVVDEFRKSSRSRHRFWIARG